MKKLIVILAAGLVALSAFAQDEKPSSTVYTSPDGVASLDLVRYVAWGYDIVRSDDFTPRGGGEVDLNIVTLNLFLSASFGIEAGVDCKWQYFNTRESSLFLDSDRIPQATKTWTSLNSKERHLGSLDAFTLSVPVVAKLRMGKIWLGGGAEANFNLTASTTDVVESDNVRTDVTMSKGKTNVFTYDFVGMAGFGTLGIFAKFYPKNSSFIPQGGVEFSYFTLGVTLFMQ